ncbi:unnamed protein product [Discula destructiva]
MVALASPLSSSPTALAPAGKVLEDVASSRAPAQRPRDIPDAVRPAGTRASLWSASEARGDVPDSRLIQTLIVRAPTAGVRPQQTIAGRESTKYSPSPETPSVVPQEDIVEHTADQAETPLSRSVGEMRDLVKMPVFAHAENEPVPVVMPPVINVIDATTPVDRSAVAHFIETPEPLVEIQLIIDSTQPMGVAQQEPTSARLPSFLQSLRQTFQNTTLNIPQASLSAPRPGFHTHAKSQSTSPDPPNRISEALTMAKKQAVMAWQPTKDNERWSHSGNVSANTDSISNAGAALRFLNTSFRALRPRSMMDMAPVSSDSLRPDPSLTTGENIQTTVVKRRVGLPVVVRMPSSPRVTTNIK